MSEAGYDGETCEGCVWRDDDGDCRNSELFEYATPCDPDFEASECEGFRSTLKCRQVRALERIADSLGELEGCIRVSEHGGYTFDVTRQP